MPLINIDLEDGLSKVSFTLMPGDAERFMAFMAECDSYKNQRDELLAALKLSTNGLRTVSRWSISEQTVAAITTQIIANEATISKAEAA